MVRSNRDTLLREVQSGVWDTDVRPIHEGGPHSYSKFSATGIVSARLCVLQAMADIRWVTLL